MKKIIATISAAMIACSLFACGEKIGTKPEGMPDAFYEAGVNCVEVIDNWLAGTVDSDTAMEKLEYYEKIFESYEDYDLPDSADYNTYYIFTTIEVEVSSINLDIDMFQRHDDAKYVQSILESRNEIAKGLNLKEKN